MFLWISGILFGTPGEKVLLKDRKCFAETPKKAEFFFQALFSRKCCTEHVVLKSLPKINSLKF